MSATSDSSRTLPSLVSRKALVISTSVLLVATGFTSAYAVNSASGNSSLNSFILSDKPCSTLSVSIPFSYRMDESVFSSKRLPVFLIVTAAKLATSSTTSTVSSRIESFLPPLIPASAIGPSASQITRSCSVRSIFAPSSSSSFSSVLASRIMIFSPLTCVLSNACVG